MLKIKTKIDKSSIHGIGLFSLENKKCGDIIGELNYLDIKVKKDDINLSDVDFFSFYFSLDGEYYQTYFDNMRFMNHSKTPNCIDTKDGLCIAVNDILIGDELTCDYSLICDMWKS